MNDILQPGDVLCRVHSVQLRQRQRRYRMIVTTGHADEMFDVPVDLRLVRTGEHDEPVYFLALRDKLHRVVQTLAVLAMAGRVTVCHKRHDAQAGYSRLRVIQ